MPGGGGYGDAAARDPAKVQKDVRNELVSREAAERDYKVVINDDLSVDEVATAAIRPDATLRKIAS